MNRLYAGVRITWYLNITRKGNRYWANTLAPHHSVHHHPSLDPNNPITSHHENVPINPTNSLGLHSLSYSSCLQCVQFESISPVSPIFWCRFIYSNCSPTIYIGTYTFVSNMVVIVPGCGLPRESTRKGKRIPFSLLLPLNT